MTEKKPTRTIGKYEIISKVAQGGMGALYKARHPTLDRVVLLKKLTLRGSSQFVERFRREARLMMDFKNDHIVQVYDHFKEGSSYFIVEEFVDGVSLDGLIQRERYLGNEAAMLILYEVARALKYAHDKQVIHRDIKPSNILISHQGELKLVDFGIATSLEETEDTLTRDGTVLGTPCYIPPEQFDDARRVDRRADIYSLGVVLYEMLTGRTPFAGTFTAETIAQIHRGRYVPPGRLNPRITPILKKIIRKSMRVHPRRRYQDLKAIIRILEKRIRRRDPATIRQAMKKVLHGEEVREIFRPKRTLLPRLAVGLAAAALAAAGGYYLYLQGYYHEYLAPARYGALVAAARISTRDKEPEEIFIKPVLYREQSGELTRVQGVEWGFRENRARRTSDSFTLESRLLHLEPGQYRLKLSLEGELYWKSFYLEPRTAQRLQLATARSLEVGVQLGSGTPLPLEVQAAAFDIDTGQDLTASTEFSVFMDGYWLACSPPVSSLLTSGRSYRFRFAREGYHPQTYSLVIQPYQTVLSLEARLIPLPGTLRLQSNEGGLALSLNGSDKYFTGGKERSYLKLQPLQAGSQELLLNPGHYLVSVQLDPLLSRSLSVNVEPEQTVTLSVECDRQKRNLAISPVD